MKWFVAILATEAIVEIWLESSLFDRLRARCDGLLGEFVTCGWCISVWVAVAVFGLVLLGLWWLLIPLAIHRLSNFAHDIFGIAKRLKWRE